MAKRRGVLQSLVLCGALTLASAGIGLLIPPVSDASATQTVTKSSTAQLPLVVLDSPEATNWVRLLRVSGAAARIGTLNEILKRKAGVVPSDSDLTSAQIKLLVNWTKQGGRLVTSQSQILQDLQIGRRPSVQVSTIEMNGLVGKALWAKPLSIRPLFSQSSGSNFTVVASTFFANNQSPETVVASQSVGRGAILALAVDPLADDRVGYELLPAIGSDVASWTRAPQGPAFDGVELYLDPGDLSTQMKDDPQLLASKLQGVRVVDLAGWDNNFTNPADDYNYSALISDLHSYGVLVYAWLEPPFVSLYMWQQDPQCREKTVSGQDAVVGWRDLIALEDPACFAIAWSEWKTLLNNYDWDGVNVAELYFGPSTTVGGETPASAAALAQFGGNPRTDPTGFATFRTALVTRLSQEILDYLNGLPKAHSLDLEMTIIDDSIDPATAAAIGVDDLSLAATARAGGADLEVEDPFTVWTQGPLRYEALLTHVASLSPGDPSLLDVNVVNRLGGRPTEKMTGGELDLALASAGANGEVAIYSYSTLSTSQIAEIPRSMAGYVQTLDTGIISSSTTIVRGPQGDNRLLVDGIEWPTANATAVIPPGENRIEWETGSSLGAGLTSFTGQLSAATTAPTSMQLSYSSQPRALAIVSELPRKLTIDGQPSVLKPIADPAGGYVVSLPAGTHVAQLSFDKPPLQQ